MPLYSCSCRSWPSSVRTSLCSLRCRYVLHPRSARVERGRCVADNTIHLTSAARQCVLFPERLLSGCCASSLPFLLTMRVHCVLDPYPDHCGRFLRRLGAGKGQKQGHSCLRVENHPGCKRMARVAGENALYSYAHVADISSDNAPYEHTLHAPALARYSYWKRLSL
jgi:hypothetical protein